MRPVTSTPRRRTSWPSRSEQGGLKSGLSSQIGAVCKLGRCRTPRAGCPRSSNRLNPRAPKTASCTTVRWWWWRWRWRWRWCCRSRHSSACRAGTQRWWPACGHGQWTVWTMRSSLGATPAWRAICRCERPPAVGAMSSAIGLAGSMAFASGQAALALSSTTPTHWVICAVPATRTRSNTNESSDRRRTGEPHRRPRE